MTKKFDGGMYEITARVTLSGTVKVKKQLKGDDPETTDPKDYWRITNNDLSDLLVSHLNFRDCEADEVEIEDIKPVNRGGK